MSPFSARDRSERFLVVPNMRRSQLKMRHSHKEAEFQVWNGPCSWFWFAPYGHGGAISVALTEAEAIREARAAIGAMTVRRHRMRSVTKCNE
jgi:hypothetical protein